jgi:peptidoglycan/LPS O-acetylase OafA/YrhL
LLGGGKWLVGLLLAFVVIGPFGRTVLAHNGVWREYSYLGGMDAIALGCLTALLVARVRFSRAMLRVFCGVGGALVVFSICFSNVAAKWGLEQSGLAMTVIAVGACMVIIAAADSQWRSPRAMRPLLGLGQRSYEVYLTHMFVVFAFFSWFMAEGKPMGAVPLLFAAVILAAAMLGDTVSRYYSELMNRWLRARWGDAPNRLGSVVTSLPLYTRLF